MKPFFLIIAFVLCSAIGRCDVAAEAPAEVPAPMEYPDVPVDNWAWGALNVLYRSGFIESYDTYFCNGNCPMTRYEFAVAIARALKGGEYKQDDERLGTTALERRDALFALVREFTPTLNGIGSKVRVDGSMISLNSAT